jgi:hypothetical protein
MVGLALPALLFYRQEDLMNVKLKLEQIQSIRHEKGDEPKSKNDGGRGA